MKKKIILMTIGAIVLAVLVFFICFFNRKFIVTFDANNGMKEQTISVKYQKTIKTEDIKDGELLGNLFIAWHEVTINEKGYRVISKNPFDFTTKIKEDINLIAVYRAVE